MSCLVQRSLIESRGVVDGGVTKLRSRAHELGGGDGWALRGGGWHLD